jgi:hypothetical protein
VLQYLSLSEYDRLSAGDKNAAAYTIIEKITEFSNSAIGIAMIAILPAIALAALAFHRSSSRVDQRTLFSSNVSPDTHSHYTHPNGNSSGSSSSVKTAAALAECFPLKEGKKSKGKGAGERDRESGQSESSAEDRDRERLRGKRVRLRLYDIEGSAVPEGQEEEEEEGEEDIEQNCHSHSLPAPAAAENSQTSNLLGRINGYFVPAKLSFSSILALTRGYMKGLQTDAEEGGDRDRDGDRDSSLGAVTVMHEREGEKGREKSGTFPAEAFSDGRSILHNDEDDNDDERVHTTSAADKLNSSIILREREREGDEEARDRERRREREGREEEEGCKGEKKLLLRI